MIKRCKPTHSFQSCQFWKRLRLNLTSEAISCLVCPHSALALMFLVVQVQTRPCVSSGVTILVLQHTGPASV